MGAPAPCDRTCGLAASATAVAAAAAAGAAALAAAAGGGLAAAGLAAPRPSASGGTVWMRRSSAATASAALACPSALSTPVAPLLMALLSTCAGREVGRVLRTCSSRCTSSTCAAPLTADLVEALQRAEEAGHELVARELLAVDDGVVAERSDARAVAAKGPRAQEVAGLGRVRELDLLEVAHAERVASVERCCCFGRGPSADATWTEKATHRAGHGDGVARSQHVWHVLLYGAEEAHPRKAVRCLWRRRDLWLGRCSECWSGSSQAHRQAHRRASGSDPVRGQAQALLLLLLPLRLPLAIDLVARRGDDAGRVRRTRAARCHHWCRWSGNAVGAAAALLLAGRSRSRAPQHPVRVMALETAARRAPCTLRRLRSCCGVCGQCSVCASLLLLCVCLRHASRTCHVHACVASSGRCTETSRPTSEQ